MHKESSKQLIFFHFLKIKCIIIPSRFNISFKERDSLGSQSSKKENFLGGGVGVGVSVFDHDDQGFASFIKHFEIQREGV